MKQKLLIPGKLLECLRRLAPPVRSWIAPMRAAALTVIALLSFEATAPAQTVTLTPAAPINFWAGVSTTNNLLTNSITVTEIGGGATTNILLAVSGGNTTTVVPTLTPSSFTANGTSAFMIAITNAAKGYYPLAISASGDATYSTNCYLFVVPQWTQTNAGSTGNWSSPGIWSGGASPLSSDSVYIDHSIPGPWTNVVDSTRAIQDLVSQPSHNGVILVSEH